MLTANASKRDRHPWLRLVFVVFVGIALIAPLAASVRLAWGAPLDAAVPASPQPSAFGAVGSDSSARGTPENPMDAILQADREDRNVARLVIALYVAMVWGLVFVMMALVVGFIAAKLEKPNPVGHGLRCLIPFYWPIELAKVIDERTRLWANLEVATQVCNVVVIMWMAYAWDLTAWIIGAILISVVGILGTVAYVMQHIHLCDTLRVSRHWVWIVFAHSLIFYLVVLIVAKSPSKLREEERFHDALAKGINPYAHLYGYPPMPGDPGAYPSPSAPATVGAADPHAPHQAGGDASVPAAPAAAVTPVGPASSPSGAVSENSSSDGASSSASSSTSEAAPGAEDPDRE